MAQELEEDAVAEGEEREPREEDKGVRRDARAELRRGEGRESRSGAEL